MTSIAELTIADEPGAWAALGFAVEGERCLLGSVRLRFAGRDARRSGPGGGLVGWTLRDLPGDRDDAPGETTAAAAARAAAPQLDGLPTTLAAADDALPAPAPAQPNGIERLDHVVAISPALDRTVVALRAAGLDLRRIREQPTPAGAPRQAFFRLGAEILEVVQEPAEVTARAGGDGERPAFFWGLALRCEDLDATVAGLGDAVGQIRDAVQPGRRIASLRREAGLALPVALMTG